MAAIAKGTIVNGNYEIIELVGAGGLGQVYKAKDIGGGKIVAIKFLHDELLSKPHLLGIFHKELLLTSAFDHRNIVTYIDSHFAPPSCFIVNDFVDGWNGSQLSKAVGPIPPAVALAMIVELLQGLDYLHMHDVVHSDLSISNIMINKTGRVLLADFGLSFDQGVESYKDRKFGTPGYVSPEHIARKSLSEESDLYCVGLILYQFIVGKRLLPAEKPSKAVKDAMKARNLSEFNIKSSSLQKEILKILKKSLAYHKFFRYNSAQHMLVDCYKLLLKCGIDHPRNAIWQMLVDKRLGEVPFRRRKQKIYIST